MTSEFPAITIGRLNKMIRAIGELSEFYYGIQADNGVP